MACRPDADPCSHREPAKDGERLRCGQGTAQTALSQKIRQMINGSESRSSKPAIVPSAQCGITFASTGNELIVDEIGYLPVVPGGGNLFFQLVAARYERGAMILPSNRGFAEWGDTCPRPRLGAMASTQTRHRALRLRQRLPSCNGPGMCPRLRIVCDARKPPAQLDCRRQLALRIEDGADRSSIGLDDDEHPQTLAMPARTSKHAPQSRCRIAF